jgi:membrane associated rhomboid family serine protease
MRWSTRLSRSVGILGIRVPTVIAALAGVFLLLSVLIVASLSLFAWGMLSPERVLGGQLWRLVTWSLFVTHPINLIFAWLVLYFFGKDLVQAWGPARFIANFVGIGVLSGGLVCLTAWLLPGLPRPWYAGPEATLTALIVAWASLNPRQFIRTLFLPPIRRQFLIYLIVGITLTFVLLDGIGSRLPDLFALAIVLAYTGWLRRLWLQVRLALLEHRLRRRASRFHVIDRDDRSRWTH